MTVGGMNAGNSTNSPTTGQVRAQSEKANVRSEFEKNKNAQNGMPNLAGGSNPEIPDVTIADGGNRLV